MYEAHYINPLIQFGKANYELILTDPDGVLPEVRHWMKFNENVTDEELIAAAKRVIDEVLAQQ